jgi:hypothetical protein
MPNWVENTIVVVGQKEMLDDFEEHKFNFNHYVPRPPEEEANWYEWNCNNWGTKWEVSEDDVSIDRTDDEKITFNFNTAWSPPIEFLRKLCTIYNKIYIECNYIDEGMVERGIVILTKNNGLIKEKSFTWEQPYNFENIEEIDDNTNESEIAEQVINITL